MWRIINTHPDGTTGTTNLKTKEIYLFKQIKLCRTDKFMQQPKRKTLHKVQ